MQHAVAHNEGLGANWKTRRAFWACLLYTSALRLKGKTSEARESESEAVSAFEQIGDKQSAARVRLTIAELLLDDGNPKEARLTASRAVEEFEKEKAARDGALAYAILSHALLREGNLVEARKTIQQAGVDLSTVSYTHLDGTSNFFGSAVGRSIVPMSQL